MNDGFGSEVPRAHSPHVLRPPARFLVLIDSGGYMVARLFSAERIQLAEFDGSTEETAQMIIGLPAGSSAAAADWDRALQGHSAAERAQGLVYTLAI
ncbi:MAG TPA: hypothetical protein VGE47_03410 [Burkholderiaceae bacterium]